MMPFGDCTVHSQLHCPLDESHKEDLMLFTGLLIGCGKKVKFCHIFRDKLVEKMADFRGNLWEFSGQKMKEPKEILLVVFTWQISFELKKSS